VHATINPLSESAHWVAFGHAAYEAELRIMSPATMIMSEIATKRNGNRDRSREQVQMRAGFPACIAVFHM
jgi:hypothetical protein